LSVPEPILSEPHAKHRLKTLDAFRGIAILAVLLYHYTYRWGPLWPDHRDFYGFQTNVSWFALGSYGVEFFFIISGFVIFLTLERCNGWRDFALRRFARLYPTYWVCMLVTFFAIHWFGNPDFYRRPVELLVGFTMLSQQFGVGWVDGSYWSLLMELVFYFWIALIFFAFRSRFLAAWVGFCVLASLVNYFDSHYGRMFFAARYLCYFTAGMAFYSVHARRPLRFVVTLFVTALALYLAFFYGHSTNEHLLVAGMVALFALFASGRLHWLGHGPLAYVGLVSYPLYLLHNHIGVSLIGHFNRIGWLNGWAAIAATSAIVFAMAVCVHYAVELPSQKIVRRLFERWGSLRLAKAA
jgi:peptidoglycan/LPS O-acetylase OafA/YrhL